MDIDNAIEVLNDILTLVKPGDPPEEHDAIKLGIEALIQTMHDREGNPLLDGELLPGETEREVSAQPRLIEE
ncbi:hypothetical protein ES705_27778 [subsurface metagenome]